MKCAGLAIQRSRPGSITRHSANTHGRFDWLGKVYFLASPATATEEQVTWKAILLSLSVFPTDGETHSPIYLLRAQALARRTATNSD
jgi:hypothetical protein